MGRGKDKQPRKLPWTPPMFLTEAEARDMGVSVDGCEVVGDYSEPGRAPQKLYRWEDTVDRAA